MENLIFLYLQRATAFVLLLQMVEYFLLRKDFGESGVWRWNHLREEYPQKLRGFFDLVLKNATAVICIGLVASNGLFFRIEFAPILLAVVVLLLLRFRGPFNGGSDQVTVMLLLVLTVKSLSPSSEFQQGALLYLGIQILLSYFVAGLAKVTNKAWWNGEVLSQLLLHSSYNVPSVFKQWARHLTWMQAASVFMLFFEISILTVLTPTNLWKCYALVGVLFHFMNFFIFGLNRFFWAWLAAYPALFYVIQRLA